MSAGAGHCEAHPERAGVGVCVECRRVLCAECSTRFEGINRCARCLQARLASVQGLAPRDDWSLGAVFQATLATLLLFVALSWVAALVGKHA
jgi:hypothetical protein